MIQAGYSRLPEVGERLRDVPKGPYVGESHVNTVRATGRASARLAARMARM